MTTVAFHWPLCTLLALLVADCCFGAERISPDLMFASGFEPGTETPLDKTDQRADDITGLDQSTGFSWDTDLDAFAQEFFLNYVDHSDGTNPEMLGAGLASDPADNNNTMYATWQHDAEYQDGGFWSRVQAELKGFAWTEVCYRVRFRLDEAIATGDEESAEDLSLSIFEIHGDPDFHLTRIMIHKWGSEKSWSNGKSPLRWRAEVRTPERNHTLYEGSYVRPRYGAWQELTFYAKAGDSRTGRYRVAIDGVTLFDERVQTKDAGLWNKMSWLKSYGGPLVRVLAEQGHSLRVDFDDVEIWRALPPGAFTPETARVVTLQVARSDSATPVATTGTYRASGTAHMRFPEQEIHRTVGYDQGRDLTISLAGPAVDSSN